VLKKQKRIFYQKLLVFTIKKLFIFITQAAQLCVVCSIWNQYNIVHDITVTRCSKYYRFSQMMTQSGFFQNTHFKTLLYTILLMNWNIITKWSFPSEFSPSLQKKQCQSSSFAHTLYITRMHFSCKTARISECSLGVCVCVHIYMCVCICACVCMCVCVWNVCVYECMYVVHPC